MIKLGMFNDQCWDIRRQREAGSYAVEVGLNSIKKSQNK